MKRQGAGGLKMSDWELVDETVQGQDGSNDWEVVEDPMEIARYQIQQQYPRMPHFLQEGLLKLAASGEHPTLEKLGNIAGHFNRAVEGIGLPAASRGLLSGLTAPVRFGANVAQYGRELAGYEPNQTLSELGAPLPEAPMGATPRIPFTDVEIPVAPTLELGGEIAGSMASGGPLFKGLMKGAEAARLPGIVSKPLAGAITGSALSPEMPYWGALIGAAAPAAGKVAKYTSENLLPSLNALRKGQKPVEAFNAMLKRHDTLADTAKQLYAETTKLAQERNLSPFRVQDDIFEPVETYFSKTPENKELIANAKKGNYKALNQLQIDMGKEVRFILGKKVVSQAELNQARELQSARERLNKSLRSQLAEQGHADIASIKQNADRLYAHKLNTYYNKNLKPTVRNVFAEGKRLRPGQTDLDLIKPFMERSGAMDEFLAHHPEMLEEVTIARNKAIAKDKLKPFANVVKTAGLGGGVVKSVEILKSLLLP